MRRLLPPRVDVVLVTAAQPRRKDVRAQAGAFNILAGDEPLPNAGRVAV